MVEEGVDMARVTVSLQRHHHLSRELPDSKAWRRRRSSHVLSINKVCFRACRVATMVQIVQE